MVAAQDLQWINVRWQAWGRGCLVLHCRVSSCSAWHMWNLRVPYKAMPKAPPPHEPMRDVAVLGSPGTVAPGIVVASAYR